MRIVALGQLAGRLAGGAVDHATSLHSRPLNELGLSKTALLEGVIQPVLALLDRTEEKSPERSK
jgi:hypothetical protein